MGGFHVWGTRGRGGAGVRQHGALRRDGGSAERGLRIGAALRRFVLLASAAGRGAAPSASRAPPHAPRSRSAVSPRGSFRPLPFSVPADPPEERPEDGAGISAGSRHHGGGRCPAPRGVRTRTDRGCSRPSGIRPGPGNRWWGRAGADPLSANRGQIRCSPFHGGAVSAGSRKSRIAPSQNRQEGTGCS